MSSPSNTALVLIDPYNDFLHPKGKMYSVLANVMKEKDTVKHIQEIVAVARSSKIPIYYGLHQPWKPNNFDGWKHMTALHKSQHENHVFEDGSWGAQIYDGLEPDLSNGDVVIGKHWSSSSFQNTDLDFQLRQRDITNLVLAGLTANACLEATARYAYELGYHITLLKDATAGFTKEATDAATDLIWPLFAHEVTTVGEYVGKLEQWSDAKD